MFLRFSFIVGLLICFMLPAYAQEMSIDDAYRAIPHKQTPYDLKQSRIKGADSKYLDHFFFASDMAMRARVMALRGFYGQSGSMSLERYNSEINDMVNSFSLIQTPRHLKGVEDTLISAVRDQQVFFNEWAKTKGTRQYENLKRNYRSHPKVQSSHQKLIQAYYKLMAMYPREVQHNKTAFFDHLCALDFI